MFLILLIFALWSSAQVFMCKGFDKLLAVTSAFCFSTLGILVYIKYSNHFWMFPACMILFVSYNVALHQTRGYTPVKFILSIVLSLIGWLALYKLWC